MSPPVHHDGLFSYQTQRGERWRVRLKFQGRKKSWRGFSNKTSARQFRDKVRTERSKGRFFPEKYSLTRGGELLTTTIDHYLTTIEHKKSARDERRYGVFWKEMFPRATVKSLTVNALEKARSTLKHSGGLQERSHATVNRYVAWLCHVINHAIARGIATTNPVTKLKAYPKTPAPTIQLSVDE